MASDEITKLEESGSLKIRMVYITFNDPQTAKTICNKFKIEKVLKNVCMLNVKEENKDPHRM